MVRGEHPFSYSDLIAHSNPLTSSLVSTAIELRSGGWLASDCENALPVVIEFLECLQGCVNFKRGSPNFQQALKLA